MQDYIEEVLEYHESLLDSLELDDELDDIAEV